MFSVNKIILDLLFPAYCVNCGKEAGFVGERGEWICKNCQKNIVRVISQVCPECGKLNDKGKYHANCGKGNFAEGIICAAYFEEGPIREMIHNFKYNGLMELANPLAELMTQALKINEIRISNHENFHNTSFSMQDTILTFVPLYWQRQAKRGYNQSEILAEKIAVQNQIDYAALLVKIKSTKRQVELHGKNRRSNLSGVFVLKKDVDIKNKKIIIVDDVMTTGSTINECAKVLKKAGAKEVWGLVIAKG